MEIPQQEDSSSSHKLNNPFYATNLWNDIVSNFKSSIRPQKHRYRFRVYDDCFSGREAVTVIYQFLCKGRELLGNKIITREKAEKVCNLLFQTCIFESIPGYNFSFKDTPNKYFCLSTGSLSNILYLTPFTSKDNKLEKPIEKKSTIDNLNLPSKFYVQHNEDDDNIILNANDLNNLNKNNKINIPTNSHAPLFLPQNSNLKISSARDIPNLGYKEDCCLSSVLNKHDKYSQSLAQSLDDLTIYEEVPRTSLYFNKTPVVDTSELNSLTGELNKLSSIITTGQNKLKGQLIRNRSLEMKRDRESSESNYVNELDVDLFKSGECENNLINYSNAVCRNKEMRANKMFKDLHDYSESDVGKPKRGEFAGNYCKSSPPSHLKISPQHIYRWGCGELVCSIDDSGVYSSRADSLNAFLEAHHYVTPQKKPIYLEDLEWNYKRSDKLLDKENNYVSCSKGNNNFNVCDGRDFINHNKINDNNKCNVTPFATRVNFNVNNSQDKLRNFQLKETKPSVKSNDCSHARSPFKESCATKSTLKDNVFTGSIFKESIVIKSGYKDNGVNKSSDIGEFYVNKNSVTPPKDQEHIRKYNYSADMATKRNNKNNKLHLPSTTTTRDNNATGDVNKGGSKNRNVIKAVQPEQHHREGIFSVVIENKNLTGRDRNDVLKRSPQAAKGRDKVTEVRKALDMKRARSERRPKRDSLDKITAPRTNKDSKKKKVPTATLR